MRTLRRRDSAIAVTIAKLASEPGAFRRAQRHFPSARAALRSWLEGTPAAQSGSVLLPGYIGWSAREGSGVFDPVRELGLRHAFYRMTDTLQIDLDDAERALRADGVGALVLIHYFGFPDPGATQLAALARSRGIPVLEDEAHAMLTDLVSGLTGRLGDAAMFSLHKLLPVADGGVLVTNQGMGLDSGDGRHLVEYDLASIARRRRENAEYLMSQLPRLAGEVEPLWPTLPAGVIPQTLPVIVRTASRDALYFAMNEAGFGVVSLYHTMIEQLSPHAHPAAHWLSRRILNLPVHQDIAAAQLDAMVGELETQLRLVPARA